MNMLHGLWMISVAALVAGCGNGASGEFREFSPESVSKSKPHPQPTGEIQADHLKIVPAVAQRPDEQANSAVAKRDDNDLIEFGGQKFTWEQLPPAVAEKPVREITLLVAENSFQAVGPERAVRVSYDDIDLLKVLNMEPVPVDCADYFPAWLKALDGQRIRIRGFMYPPFEATGLRGFVLARDNDICCFGRDPKRYDVIDVFMRKGVTTDYIQNRPFDVVGVFHIEPEAVRGQLIQLYVIDDATVIAK